MSYSKEMIEIGSIQISNTLLNKLIDQGKTP